MIKNYYNKYLAASKSQKSRILSILEENTGLHRKHLIRRLNQYPIPRKKRGGSKPIYPVKETEELLQLLWECHDYSCAELMHSTLNDMIDTLYYHGDIPPHISKKTIDLVRKIPMGTLKWKLKGLVRPPSIYQSSYQNRSKWQLKKDVVVNTKMNKANQLGYLELDFVDHTGENASGIFARSLCCVDVYTQFICRYCVLGKRKASVITAFEDIVGLIPFTIKHLHTDNEPNLLTSMILQQAVHKSIGISRSRSYRKEDNGHVEQKNGDKIRRLVGYRRFDTKQHVALLNQIYSIDDLIQNHFVASKRVLKKEYASNGKLIRRAYDEGATPYLRAIQSNEITEEEKEELEMLHKRLNPLELMRNRTILIKKLRGLR